MPTLVHISDLHFGRAIPRVVDGLVDEITCLDPDAVILSGDLTQRARAAEYRAAQHFLNQLARRCHPIPGNHDLAAFNLVDRFLFPWRNWRRYVACSLEFVESGRGYAILGINTARRLAAPFDWSRGRISRRQMEHVARVCREADPQALRILIAHHPFWIPAEQAHRHRIQGCEEALEVFRQAEVDIICGGHIHLAYIHVLDGMILSHAGTSTSDRTLANAGNSFHLIRGNRRRIEIIRYAWGGERFEAVGCFGFRRGEAGWARNGKQSPNDYREDTKIRA